MTTRYIFPALLIALPVSAFAESCAPPPVRTTERADLLETLKATQTPATGQQAANAVWAFWVSAPDERAQSLLDQGMQSRGSGDLLTSEALLDELVAYCPEYAEGWNQRAFTRFLANDYEGSLADIEETLAREPAHFGALAGEAFIHLRRGHQALAEIALRRAIAVHPWMSERALLNDEGEAL